MFFNDFGERNMSLILYCFYKGFMKTDLAVGGGFQVCDFVLFYCGLLMIAVSWKGQNVKLYSFDIGFIRFRET